MPACRAESGTARRLVAALAFAFPVSLQSPAAEPDEGAIPSFAELQEAGAVVGEVIVLADNIFDLDDPKENNVLFRLANRLHIRTRPGVVRRMLLFRSGDPLSVRLIEESERILRNNRYLYDVSIVPVAWHDGVVDIEVRTRDTWTLDPGLSFSRSGGENSSGIAIEENNFLGTGTTIGISRKSDVDRTGTEFNIGNSHVFGGWTDVNYMYGDLDDGKKQSIGLSRPFYSLDTRWAAGVLASEDERIDSVYAGGDIIGQYRHRQEYGEVYGGWSKGLVKGRTQRYSVGLSFQDDDYGLDPALAPPPQTPVDTTLAGPYLRYEVVEDKFEKLKNLDQIERAEYVLAGFSADFRVGRAFTGLGSTRDLWTYEGELSNGHEFARDHLVLVSGSFSGRYGDGRGERQFLGGSARYYRPQGKRTLFYAAIAVDAVRNPEIGDLLLLGGDNGLRGYPLRYQTGERRVMLNLEQRVYTDWYPFRLIRVGGAVFFDTGRAWGGDVQNTANPGWLSDIGFGLRLLSARSSSGTVWHADVAFPLNRDPEIDSVQFLFKSRVSF